MNLRTALHLIVGTLVAASLIFFASSVAAGPGSSITEMMDAQRHVRILWIIDVIAIGLIAMMWWFAVTSNHVESLFNHQASQHHEQLNEMIERTLELEQTNDSYAGQIERFEADVARRFRDLGEQIAALETAANARREVFEMEARRLAEHAHQKLQAQLDTNTDQVEAVNASLQFQRSELRRLRQAVGEIQLSSPRTDALPPAAVKADSISQNHAAATGLSELPSYAASPNPLSFEQDNPSAPPEPTGTPDTEPEPENRRSDTSSTASTAEAAA